jgi:ATP-dependent RNA helicase DDX56/DBP9
MDLNVEANVLDPTKTWTQFNLDPRIEKAISKIGWVCPTLIQSSAIPLALQGKDILAKATTGSGKTGTYAIPIIHRLLLEKMENETASGIKALVLVPSTDLTQQVRDVFVQLIHYCPHLISVYYIASDISVQAQKPRLAELPDILVATPARLVQHIDDGNIDITKLKMIVIDEADLTLSYGYQKDLEKIKNYLPRICQGFLMSATLSPEIQSLKQLVLHTPVILELEEERLEDELLNQYTVETVPKDKFLILYAIFSLKFVKGKTIIFVNDIDNCYRLKLFLERFSIKSAVLNSELPQNSRFHIVEEFNRGVFDILIATDEETIDPNADDDLFESPVGSISIKEETLDSNNTIIEDFSEDDNMVDEDINNENQVTQKKSKKKKDKAYGVSRGIDFRNVSNVINFDFPHSVKNYIHRIGRTARAGNYGTALSFVAEEDITLLDKIKEYMVSKKKVVNPFKFKMNIIENFRYRVDDVLKSVTGISVKNAKITELKNEILNSKKLKMHFEENPQDLKFLKHDKHLQTDKIQSHLRHIPTYLLPNKTDVQSTITNPNAKEDIDSKIRLVYSVKSLRKKTRKNDPLKNFSINNRKRKFDETTTDANKNRMKRRKLPQKKKKKRIDKINVQKFKQ